MSVADEIRKLSELRDSGALSSAEFERAKARLLGSVASDAMPDPAGTEHPSGYALPTINRLRRSETDRWISGVCGGLAEFSGVDSWIWRLGFTLAFIFAGISIVAYILLWIFVPAEDPI